MYMYIISLLIETFLQENQLTSVYFFQPEYKIADPICTFIFSVIVLFTTILILRDIFVILMEGMRSF